MSDEKPRPYRKKRRAEAEARTARRITESAVELHGTIGPARTSISAVARHAGVRRSTVYRYFPDEAALFTACSTHWMASNPPPGLEVWAAVEDPDRRLSVALRELCAYYRRNSQMLENILRDEDVVSALKQTMVLYRGFLAAARDVLMAGRTLPAAVAALVAAAIGHALSFHTWRSLALEQGLDDTQAAALMCRLIASVSAA